MGVTMRAKMLMVAGLLLAHTPQAVAQDARWSAYPLLGASITAGSDMVKPSSINYTGAAFGVPVTVQAIISKTAFEDAFQPVATIGGGISYGRPRRAEIYGELAYSHGAAQEFTIGQLTAAATINGTVVATNNSLRGEFSDYREGSLSFGHRRYFGTAALSPFVNLAAGVSYVDKLDMRLKIGGIEAGKIAFTKASLVPHAYAGIGLAHFGTDMALGFEFGLRARYDLTEDDKDLAAIGAVSESNDGLWQLSAPIRGWLKMKF